MHRTEKRANGICDGLGLFWEGESWDFQPFALKSVNARVYRNVIKLLEYTVLPVVQRTNDSIGDAVFQQDNAPVHTASVATEWFEQHNIPVNKHPPYVGKLERCAQASLE